MGRRVPPRRRRRGRARLSLRSQVGCRRARLSRPLPARWAGLAGHRAACQPPATGRAPMPKMSHLGRPAQRLSTPSGVPLHTIPAIVLARWALLRSAPPRTAAQGTVQRLQRVSRGQGAMRRARMRTARPGPMQRAGRMRLPARSPGGPPRRGAGMRRSGMARPRHLARVLGRGRRRATPRAQGRPGSTRGQAMQTARLLRRSRARCGSAALLPGRSRHGPCQAPPSLAGKSTLKRVLGRIGGAVALSVAPAWQPQASQGP